MQSQNISDIIEKYLKSILAESQEVEIKRSEMAQLFNCVPSQINYVIKTRFNIQNGYIVRSKRGGGGYIRIAKVNLVDDYDVLDELITIVGDSINFKDAFQLIQSLFQASVLSQMTANLLLAVIDKKTLSFGDSELENMLRARIMKSILTRLKYDD
ncbi:CtsR family transcriptional regulator [Liquorilactobacillus nagelii]|jgi:transcriptional regulator CtsR|uniref:Transcriptional regulator CtsR n=2 Tax=Liquorilactobacillus nagelii TaxID=82688 RepID=A0A3S6QU65_9LACO|nr:CtsR family transcriptional regulator [Liquorilactobacillus nagelii]AUJ31299.1 CtsR family transcriptional regulator [Liquorilactobacillus nagelii]KRL40340.1 transcriptional regulator CtsR [Liquorilactobacillus nagelii DSM 13675]MCC7616890.1 CtsR family transcriptional regulator [Liquorilactobacillus nagelii]MCI1633494.1 CtsR family transcriptional regulator [Liquorilactobacillus nagelii]MCI1700353.1 CtsR family transcriptional regulator [Liquorilactobacillus nagelii]